MVYISPAAAIIKYLLLNSGVFLKRSNEFAIAPVLNHPSTRRVRSVGPDMIPRALNTTFGSNLLRSAMFVARNHLHIDTYSAG